MADNSSSMNFPFPWMLDTIGSYNPVTSWQRAMNQIGFINIENMSSGDPDLEKEIISKGGGYGYGRQLGRIMETLQAVLSHLDQTNWESDEKRAVRDFTSMADDIEALKSKNQPATKETIDQLVIQLRALRDDNKTFYDQVLQRLPVLERLP